MLLPANFIYIAMFLKNCTLVEQNFIFVKIMWINMLDLLSIYEFISYL